MDQIIAKILEHGPFGLVAAYFLWKNWELTKRLRHLQDARQEESKEHSESNAATRETINSLKAEMRAKLDSIRDFLVQRK